MKPVVQKVVCGGVLLREGKVLIVQRSKNDTTFPGLWEIPSGKKENFEDPADTARREFKEEAGVDVEIVKPISVFAYKSEKENETRDVTQINFLVKSDGGEVKLSEEHDNFAWITESEINNYNISEETKKVLRSAFE